ncbi:MAG: hydroxyacid dehydrogenase [Clostridia bacterium]
MNMKVLIPQDIAAEGKKYLLDRGYEIKMGSGITTEILKEEVEDCDAILARTAILSREVLEAGKKLKVISRYGVGVDNIDIRAAKELGIYVTNAPLGNVVSVAEQTIGFIIACSRNFVKCNKELRNGDYELRNKFLGSDLEGKVLGVIGLGKIGTKVAKKATLGLDMKVVGFDPYVKREQITPEIELASDLGYLLENSDFISMHVPTTEETREMMGKNEFKMMKETAYFINCARGEVVNEDALFEALVQKEIAGAALDVFNPEPPLKDNKLFELDNVLVTPHNAGLTRESVVRVAIDAAKGIDEVLTGKKPSWPVASPD